MRGFIAAQNGVLKGTIKSEAVLTGTIKALATVSGTIQMAKTVTVYVGSGEHELYTGSYDITPKVTPQVMHTANKFMLDDVTIRKVPVHRVSNTGGGTTVYIATEDIYGY